MAHLTIVGKKVGLVGGRAYGTEKISEDSPRGHLFENLYHAKLISMTISREGTYYGSLFGC